MRRPYGVYVKGMLMNRFLTHLAAQKLVTSFAIKGLQAEIKIIGDVLEPK